MFKSRKIQLLMVFIPFVCAGQNYFELGYKEYYNNNNFEKAIDLFTKAIENEQNLSQSFLLRGAAKINNGKYFGVLTDLDFSIELDSNNYKAYYYYGRFYFTQGFFKSSIQYYEKAIIKNNECANCYDDLAIAISESNLNYSLSLEYENKAINIAPKNSIYLVNRGIIKTKLNLLDEALIDFEEAIKIDESPQAYANRGITYSKLNEHNKAIDDFTIAIKKLELAKDLPYLRGIEYIAIGKRDLACVDFLNSFKLGYKIAENKMKEYCKK